MSRDRRREGTDGIDPSSLGLVAEYELVQNAAGDWDAFPAPDVAVRAPSRTEAVARAQVTLLRAFAAQIERGNVTVADSFVVSIRRKPSKAESDHR
jgi:hypothetical protein